MMQEASFMFLDGGVGFLSSKAMLVVDDEFAFVAVEVAEEDGGCMGEGREVREWGGEAEAVGGRFRGGGDVVVVGVRVVGGIGVGGGHLDWVKVAEKC